MTVLLVPYTCPKHGWIADASQSAQVICHCGLTAKGPSKEVLAAIRVDIELGRRTKDGALKKGAHAADPTKGVLVARDAVANVQVTGL